MREKIVQLVPWRDMLLALSDQGNIYATGIGEYGSPTACWVPFMPNLQDALEARAREQERPPRED